jgi:UDP-glucose 4-epimerase
MKSELDSKRFLVTGGAGFIGSHLVDFLASDLGTSIYVIDDLSTTGNLGNLSKWLYENSPVKYCEKNILSIQSSINELQFNKLEIIFHLAAIPDVRYSSVRPAVHFDQNIRATYNLLEISRKMDVDTFVFTSSSTVYGEPEKLPTPENYGPLKPISVYGASKLACESMISGYANTYGFNAVIYRLANIIGARSNHGIIYDFVQKLRENPNRLEIFGDGTQSKSYLHISDCIKAMLVALENPRQRVEIFNVGSVDAVDVMRIVEIIRNEMGLSKIYHEFTLSGHDGRGWPGDVKTMLLDLSRLQKLGWTPRMNSEQAIRLTAKTYVTDNQFQRPIDVERTSRQVVRI